MPPCWVVQKFCHYRRIIVLFLTVEISLFIHSKVSIFSHLFFIGYFEIASLNTQPHIFNLMLVTKPYTTLRDRDCHDYSAYIGRNRTLRRETMHT